MNRRQEGDALVPQATQGDLQDAGGRRVEPLEVVDRDQDGPSLREQAKRVEKCQPDRVRIGRLLSRLGDEEGHLEGAPAGDGSAPATSSRTPVSSSERPVNASAASAWTARHVSTRSRR